MMIEIFYDDINPRRINNRSDKYFKNRLLTKRHNVFSSRDSLVAVKIKKRHILIVGQNEKETILYAEGFLKDVFDNQTVGVRFTGKCTRYILNGVRFRIL